MVRISTFVFFDIETTGLPYQELNRTKITELCLIAVTRNDMRMMKDNPHDVRQICKLTFVLNPLRSIQPAAALITGLTNDMLKNAPTFENKFNTIYAFLEDLKEPVCLVAHNGNTFDYKILLAECADANVTLPKDLLCADSLPGFRKLFQAKNNASVSKTVVNLDESILTDDSDDDNEWPDLNITPEDYKEIDELSSSLSELSHEENPIKKNGTFKKASVVQCKSKKKCISYKLTDIYKRLFNEEPENAHRAEDDCLMLLQCVAACQNPSNEVDDFMHWFDGNCKILNTIVPLKRK